MLSASLRTGTMRPVTSACCGASPSAAIGGLLPYLDHLQLTGPPLQHNPSALLNGWRRVELAWVS
jgi:hypothetical protein